MSARAKAALPRELWTPMMKVARTMKTTMKKMKTTRIAYLVGHPREHEL
jgi:hypothetical protein